MYSVQPSISIFSHAPTAQPPKTMRFFFRKTRCGWGRNTSWFAARCPQRRPWFRPVSLPPPSATSPGVKPWPNKLRSRWQLPTVADYQSGITTVISEHETVIEAWNRDGNWIQTHGPSRWGKPRLEFVPLRAVQMDQGLDISPVSFNGLAFSNGDLWALNVIFMSFNGVL